MQKIIYTGVPGGMCQTSGDCSLSKSTPIQPKKNPISKVERLRR